MGVYVLASLGAILLGMVALVVYLAYRWEHGDE